MLMFSITVDLSNCLGEKCCLLPDEETRSLQPSMPALSVDQFDLQSRTYESSVIAHSKNEFS